MSQQQAPPSFTQFYAGIKKDQQKWGSGDLMDLRDLPNGLSRVRPFPAVTQDPQDAFLLIYYHSAIIPRTPEELENMVKNKREPKPLKAIVCEDGLNGNPGGTDCLVCRLTLFLLDPKSEEWSRYLQKVREHKFTRTMYFSGIIIPEKVETSAPQGFTDPEEAEKDQSNQPRIFSTSSDPVIEKINYWLGRPSIKEDAPVCGAEEKSDFNALLNPKTGRPFHVTKKVSHTKNGKDRTELEIALGTRVIELDAEMLKNAPDLEKFKKITDAATVRANLMSLYPQDLLKAANIIG